LRRRRVTEQRGYLFGFGCSTARSRHSMMKSFNI
jgi:hypothetical protein